MSSELLKLCDPDAHYDKFLDKGIYPDGRSIQSFSSILFKNGGYGGIGSSLVQQGGVTVSCSISAEICLQSDGPLIIPLFENSPDIPEETTSDVLDTLTELLSLKEVLPRSALICKGSEDAVPLTWRLTIKAFSNGASLMDSVVGAVTYALSSIKLPHIKVAHSKDDEAPIEKREISVLPEKSLLELSDIPVCSTFGIYKTTTLSQDNTIVLADPPTEIFDRCSTTCTVIVGKNKILNFKLHGTVADNTLLDSVFEMAIGHQQAVAKSIAV